MEDNGLDDKFLALRQRAEAMLREHSRHIDDISAEEFLHLLNELEIHQIELELQNEDLRTAQRELEQSRSQYRDLYEFAPVGYLTIDKAGIITAINLTGASMLGLDRRRVIQRPAGHFVAVEDRDSFYLYCQRLFTAQTTESVELRLKRADGSSFWTRLEGVPGIMEEDDSSVQLCQITMSDISAHKQAKADALALKLEQEKVEILRQFIGDVSHDLKTPLTVLKTSTYLMRRQNAEEDRQHQLDIIETQITRLGKTLEGLLSMVRLDQEAEFEFETLDANGLVGQVMAAHQDMARQRGHTLTAALSETPLLIWGDRMHLDRALSNLVANALNYMSEPGIVTLRTYPNQKYAIIEVRDTGIGISAIDLPHLFDRFFRGESARNVFPGGTGLGLAITYKVIEAHGGRIEVESAVGVGSLFRVYLPLLRHG